MAVSIHVFLGRPLFLLSRGIQSIINFGILSSGILLTIFGSEEARQTDHVANIVPKFPSRLQSAKAPPRSKQTVLQALGSLFAVVLKRMFLQKLVQS